MEKDDLQILLNSSGVKREIIDYDLKCWFLYENPKNKISGKNMQERPLLLFGRIDKRPYWTLWLRACAVKDINDGFEQEEEETFLFIR